MIRIVIVEDRRVVREGLAVLLGAAASLVVAGRYATAEDMLAARPADAPDLVLMDIGLPGMSGIDATRRLKERDPAPEVLILTVHEDDGNIFKALCAGACGYLLKDTPPADLIAAVEDAHAGGSPMSSRIARRVVNLFQERFPVPRARAGVGLTAREQQVLTALADGHSYAAIADTLCLAPDTVRFHIRNIYRKLHVHSQTAAVARAIREDLI